MSENTCRCKCFVVHRNFVKATNKRVRAVRPNSCAAHRSEPENATTSHRRVCCAISLAIKLVGSRIQSTIHINTELVRCNTLTNRCGPSTNHVMPLTVINSSVTKTAETKIITMHTKPNTPSTATVHRFKRKTTAIGKRCSAGIHDMNRRRAVRWDRNRTRVEFHPSLNRKRTNTRLKTSRSNPTRPTKQRCPTRPWPSTHRKPRSRSRGTVLRRNTINHRLRNSRFTHTPMRQRTVSIHRRHIRINRHRLRRPLRHREANATS